MTDEEMGRQAQTLKACLPERLRKPNLRRWEASEYLLIVYGIVMAPATFAKKATTGGGPCFRKAGKGIGGGRTPYYPVDELDRWAMQHLGRLVASTSENSAEALSPQHHPAGDQCAMGTSSHIDK